jgi:transcriptional regulator
MIYFAIYFYFSYDVSFPFEKVINKFSDIDKIPEELIQTGDPRTYKFTWNKEELLEHWKESAIVHVYKKDYKTDDSNNGGISLLSAIRKILSNIFLSRLTLYIDWGSSVWIST